MFCIKTFRMLAIYLFVLKQEIKEFVFGFDKIHYAFATIIM